MMKTDPKSLNKSVKLRKRGERKRKVEKQIHFLCIVFLFHFFETTLYILICCFTCTPFITTSYEFTYTHILLLLLLRQAALEGTISLGGGQEKRKDRKTWKSIRSERSVSLLWVICFDKAKICEEEVAETNQVFLKARKERTNQLRQPNRSGSI